MSPHSDSAGSVRFERPRSATTTTLGVVADVHLTRGQEGTWKSLDHTEGLLATAVRFADRRAVDALLVLGDLTNGGTAAQLQHAEDHLATMSCPVLGVPGNHDAPGQDEALFASDVWARAPSETPFVYSLDGIDVVGLDSTAPAGCSSAGVIDEDGLNRLASATNSSRPLVVMTHHPTGVGWSSVAEVLPDGPFRLGNAAAVHHRLAGTGALVLAGHVHWPMRGVGAGAAELVCPAACSYPQMITVVTVGPEGTTVEFVTLSDRTRRAEALSCLRDDPVLNGAYVALATTAAPEGAADADRLDRLDWQF